MRLTKPTILKYTLSLIGFIVLTAAMVVAYIGLISPPQDDLVESQANTPIVDTSTQLQPVSSAPPQPLTGIEKNNNEVAKLQQEQEKLSKEFDKLQSHLLKELQDKPSVEIGPNEDIIDESPEAEEERLITELVAHKDLLDHTLEGEAWDYEWSNEAITALQVSKTQYQDTSIEMIDVDCGSTLCRVMLNFTPGEHENSIRHFQNALPWAGEMFFQVEDINTGEAVIYISRENHSLPKISE
jgi:hypothetical protein